MLQVCCTTSQQYSEHFVNVRQRIQYIRTAQCLVHGRCRHLRPLSKGGSGTACRMYNKHLQALTLCFPRPIIYACTEQHTAASGVHLDYLLTISPCRTRDHACHRADFTSSAGTEGISMLHCPVFCLFRYGVDESKCYDTLSLLPLRRWLLKLAYFCVSCSLKTRVRTCYNPAQSNSAI